MDTEGEEGISVDKKTDRGLERSRERRSEVGAKSEDEVKAGDIGHRIRRTVDRFTDEDNGHTVRIRRRGREHACHG